MVPGRAVSFAASVQTSLFPVDQNAVQMTRLLMRIGIASSFAPLVAASATISVPSTPAMRRAMALGFSS